MIDQANSVINELCIPVMIEAPAGAYSDVDLIDMTGKCVEILVLSEHISQVDLRMFKLIRWS